MENNDVARELAREADRAEAAPWVDYPPTPAWYPPSVGLWGAALVLALGVLDGVWGAVATLLLVALEVWYLRWYRSYRGAMPTGPMPLELRGAALTFGIGLALLVAAGVVSVVVGLAWVGAAIVLVAGTPLVWWYERAYAAAAVATRARLA